MYDNFKKIKMYRVTKIPVANPLVLNVYAKKNKLKNRSLRDKRLVCAKWCQEKLVGKTVRTPAGVVEFTWQSLKNDISHHHGNNSSKIVSFVADWRDTKRKRFN